MKTTTTNTNRLPLETHRPQLQGSRPELPNLPPLSYEERFRLYAGAGPLSPAPKWERLAIIAGLTAVFAFLAAVAILHTLQILAIRAEVNGAAFGF